MRGILLPQTHSKGAMTPWWGSLPPGTIFNFFPDLKKKRSPLTMFLNFQWKYSIIIYFYKISNWKMFVLYGLLLTRLGLYSSYEPVLQAGE